MAKDRLTEKWEEVYKSKLMTAEQAVQLVPDGADTCTSITNSMPQSIINALIRRMASGDLKNVSYIHSLEVRLLDLFNPELLEQASKHNSLEIMYCGPISRNYAADGRLTYVPHRLNDGPYMSVIRNLKACFITVSPMDQHGFVSMGISPDYAYGMIRHNPGCLIIAEVNKHMPRTFGNNHFHITELAAVVENDLPLVQLPDIPVSEKDKTIGRYIADLVPDGACLQVGIGAIPNAVSSFITDKKDLGIHSEMLCDSMLDLYEAGAITGVKKQYMPRKWIGCFAIGSQRLYDFIEENPMIEMHSSDLVNDPAIIGLNDNVVSINATLQVDLSGQCASESIGPRQYSGAGGQMDFVEGARRSRGGKPIIALYSTYTDKAGKEHSSINPMLTQGSYVTTTRNDVQYLVSEYGVAFLKGANMRQRVERIINIAHPDFRDDLLKEAKKLNFIK